MEGWGWEAPGPRLQSGGEGRLPAPSEAGDMGNGESLVGRDPWGRGWEGSEGGGGWVDPSCIPRGSAAAGAGMRACQRDSGADGQTPSRPPPLPARKCQVLPRSRTPPLSGSEWGVVPSLFPGNRVPLWAPRPGEAGEVQTRQERPSLLASALSSPSVGYLGLSLPWRGRHMA